MSIETKPCGSCGTPVYWLRSVATGKPAPIEVEASERGNIAVDLLAGTYSVVPAPERASQQGPLHLNHFVGCPQRASWAKGGGRYRP